MNVRCDLWSDDMRPSHKLLLFESSENESSPILDTIYVRTTAVGVGARIIGISGRSTDRPLRIPIAGARVPTFDHVT